MKRLIILLHSPSRKVTKEYYLYIFTFNNTELKKVLVKIKKKSSLYLLFMKIYIYINYQDIHTCFITLTTALFNPNLS